jgi:PAS domain S-box-containing protein
MTLRQKTLLIIGVTLLCLLMALYISLSTIWLNGFAQIELQQTRQNVERVTQALANDLKELNRTARDWAGWDDTYAFVQDGNDDYIQENLIDTTFVNLRLNFMLFINTAGQIAYAKGLDLQQKVVTPIPKSLNQYLAANSYLFQHRNLNNSHKGIVLLPEGPLLIASQSILKSDRIGPSRGILLLGRFLNAAEVTRFSELTRLSLTVYPFRDANLPEDFQSVRTELGQDVFEADTQVRSPILVRRLSAKRIAGYTLLRDIKGQPGLLLRVDNARDIYQQSQQGLRYLVTALFVVSLTFGIVALLLLEKWVLSPLARFSTAVRRIRVNGDLSERLSIDGKDELSRLGTAINQLLATLQQSQLQLCQSEEQYRSVVNNVTEVIFQTDATGNWTFLNPAWTEITGFSIEESIGKSCRMYIHPEDQAYYDLQFYQLQFYQLTQGKTKNTRYEIRYRVQDGSDRWFEVHSRLTLGSNSEITGTAGTLNDITEQKLAEAREREKAKELNETLLELTQTQAQLIQSEKLSILGQLVAGVAHEINNPLSSVYGNICHASQYIQDLLNLIECYQQYYPSSPDTIQAEKEKIDFDFLVDDLPKALASMKIGTERICEIVQSLQSFSRMNESEKAVDIHEGIESTLLILRHKLKAKGEYAEIELIKEYGELPWVECYPGQLNQVLMNLIVNAIDALEERRKSKRLNASQDSPFIRIRTEAKQGNLLLNSEQDTSNIFIRIADNGTGMTEDVCNRLFNPFFTTKSTGKGTGLGLSISYQIIVEKHQGKLLVNSELGKGSEFIIELPIQQSG